MEFKRYKIYENRDLMFDWDKLIKLSKKEVEKTHEEWLAVEKENEEIRKFNQNLKTEKIDNIINIMKESGIDPYKYKRNSIKITGYQAWFKNNVYSKITWLDFGRDYPSVSSCTKTIDGFDITTNKYYSDIVKLYEFISNKLKREKDIKYENDKLYLKSVEYAKENNVVLEGVVDPKDIIRIVDEHAKRKYENDNYSGGEEVYLKHGCDYCDTWYYGDRRCSCGNRRVYLEVEGDLLNGYYDYPVYY